MCANKECISHDYCERTTAQPSKKRQSWAFFCGNEPGWTHCDSYIPNEKAKVFEILSQPTIVSLTRTFEPMGYKGKTTADTGLYYAPYIPTNLTK